MSLAYWLTLGAVGLAAVVLVAAWAVRSLSDPAAEEQVARRAWASSAARFDRLDRWLAVIRSEQALAAEESAWSRACAVAAADGRQSVAHTHTPHHDRRSLNRAIALELTGGIPPTPPGTAPVERLRTFHETWCLLEDTQPLPVNFLLP